MLISFTFSNGIRFSISDLSPPTARNIPTLYQDRAAISLYDVQYSSGPKTPIPVETIQNICASLLKFKCTCEDFEVPQKNIRVLATEATRDAINSVEFRRQIIEATGWEVDMLPKVEEGRIGAMGVASSFRSIDGLVMDLGGGSTQITYLQTRRGEVHFGSGGSVSLPFGAAALLRRMNAASQHGMRAMAALKKEVQESLLAAYRSLEVPEEVERNGLSLFLSGGGFRGWGYVLMDKHVVNPYPIPIINGFSVKPDMFQDVVSVESHIVAQGGTMLGVSQRRATQVPAVAFLISALTEALPEIKEVRFCQGGVREGALFSSLPPSIRNQSPLDTATLAYAPPSSKSLSVLLSAAVPSPCPPILSSIFLATVHLLYFHGPLPAENRAAAALRCTTSGLLAGVHGLLHEERTALALLLCERWGGEIPVTDAVFHWQGRKWSGG